MLAHVEQILLLLDGDVETLRFQLCRALFVGKEPTWTQDHHQHQSKTEHDVAVFADVVVGEEIVADPFAKGVERLRQSLGQDAVKRSNNERADDRPKDVSDAAEDDRGEDQDRQRELELTGMDVLERG